MATTLKADEVIVKLKDKSTSFHDISQGKGVVADRLAILKKTAKVAQALHHSQLVECTAADYDAYLSKASEAPAKKAVVTAPAATDKTPSPLPPAATKKTATKKEAEPKPEKEVKKVADKKSLTDDDDDDDADKQ